MDHEWTGKAAEVFFALQCLAPTPIRAMLTEKLAEIVRNKPTDEVSEQDVFQLANDLFGGRAGKKLINGIKGKLKPLD